MSLPPGRVLAVDWGAKRFGLAICDELGVSIRGLPTLERRSRREDRARLAAIIREQAPARIVVGHPVNLDGSESESSRQARKLARTLSQNCGVPVELWDERLSSTFAVEILQQRGESSHEKGRLDQVAAAVILRSFLDHLADQENAQQTQHTL